MSTQSQKLTPMLEQYLRIKQDYPDALLFYRMGDFYELFFEDARVAARELQIVLTSRNKESEDQIPMAGVPHHSAEEYLKTLLERRYKIAICEQMEDPSQAKGLVERAVTRILTPGTVVEDSTLQAKRNNYLAAICFRDSGSEGGLCWLDYSTGEWSGIFSKQPGQIWQWLQKINPGEILCPEGLSLPEGMDEIKERITRLPFSAYFEQKRAREVVCRVQDTASLKPLDLEDKPQLVQACGAVLTYLMQTQKEELSHLQGFSPLDLSRYLILDEATETNLELFRRLDGEKGQGTLWHVLDETMTPMGGRLLQKRLKQPYRDLGPIQATQEAVAFFLELEETARSLRAALDGVYDLERLCTRITLQRSTPKDFEALRSSLLGLPELKRVLDAAEGQRHPRELRQLLRDWDCLEDVAELLRNSLVDNPPQLVTEGGLFRQGYSPELDELLELAEHGEAKLSEILAREQEENDLPKLKLGQNRVFGYYFELSRAHKGSVPDHFIRRQTLVNAERYVTEELKQLEERIYRASEKRKSLEQELFHDLRRRVLQASERIRSAAERVARLDLWQCLAEAARKREWTRPELHGGLEVEIDQGRHPAVEDSLGRANYIPNDLHMDQDRRIILITGPNMAGKSTVLRQAAIIAILAQMGAYVPADRARIGLCDRVFTRVGASDNLTRGQSTFMLEMIETARILRQAGKRSLLILDEIGRGTSTFDGLSLAWAIVENLAGRGEGGIRSLFATHYHELTDLASSFRAVANMNIAVTEWNGEIVFLRKLVPGPADKSYGIEVARLAGVPKSVTQRAKEILGRLEAGSEYLRPAAKQQARRGTRLLPGLGKKEAHSEETTKTPERHPILEELERIDPEGMTPLQALQTLAQWKECWGCRETEDRGQTTEGQGPRTKDQGQREELGNQSTDVADRSPEENAPEPERGGPSEAGGA
jgi:DNA mismatch repair protein MutS